MPQTRILYVEDNEDLRDSIAMVLEEDADYTLTVCASGEEGLAQLTQCGCDVLLTDVGLPGLSGLDLAREALTLNPQQWVLLCSGYDMAHELTGLGPNVRTLTKPFELDTLEKLLKDISSKLRTARG
ncbi:MAG TPA: response regulator [Pseudorhodoferax sp.]|jgi:CheY-like chemotaxis protein|nr:response regulator [Pseudorhodoferax sp.]